jgi:hypothetical protein
MVSPAILFMALISTVTPLRREFRQRIAGLTTYPSDGAWGSG